MSDEIKEILDNVKKCCDITKDQSFTVYQRQDILAILDYITNLQQENERLKVNCNLGYEELKNARDNKSRVEKAIEYINKHTDKLKTIRAPKIDFNYNNLLNILQGGKDEQ